MSSKILTQEKISAAAQGSWQVLLELDKHGLFPSPGENAQQFSERLTKLAHALRELEDTLPESAATEIAPGIKLNAQAAIPAAIRGEALNTVNDLYGVKPDWVPGFFADESFGALWGGCALSDEESGLVLFIIRKIFAKKRRWLFYDRRELMAHEMTHAAHQSLREWQLEEYFAYQTAKSPLRRFFGSCFIHKFDAAGFLGPILLLPVMQILNMFHIVTVPMWIFYLLAAVYPLWLLCRCCYIEKMVNKARKFLVSNKIKQPGAVLFRLTCSEVKALGRGEWFAGNDLRTELIRRRFEINNKN